MARNAVGFAAVIHFRTQVISQIVPARSEHRFRGAAPYNVWIGYALGAEVNYGGEAYSVSRHMVGKKSASLMVGEK